MLAHWDPFTEMSRIHDRMRGRGWLDGEVDFRPPVDIYEDDKGIHVKAELPGLKPDDIKVNVENRVLTISGERKFENEEKKDNYHRVERYYGSFNRSFALPHEVATDEIDAHYDDGVLSVTLPRRPETRPREIQIKKG